LDPGEVEALVGQLLDALEELDVGLAVAAAAALRPRRFEEALALVDAQGLRVDAGQFGGDRYDVDGSCSALAHSHS
jgi:hypothetical protein